LQAVCRPHELGGLGVANLRRVDVALRVRWSWLHRVDQDKTWWSLPDLGVRTVVTFFAAATVSALGNGETSLFWTDNWIQGSSVRCLAPTVFAVVPRFRRSTTIAEALNDRAWVHQIIGPRTMRLLT
jgi:hypothetical protein